MYLECALFDGHRTLNLYYCAANGQYVASRGYPGCGLKVYWGLTMASFNRYTTLARKWRVIA